MSVLKKSVPLKLGPLVVVHVDLSSAVETKKSLTTFCDQGHEPTAVKRPTVCESCGATEGFKKGTKIGGELRIVDESTVNAARQLDQAIKEQIVLTVHNSNDVMEKTIPSGPSYFVSPSKGSEEAYAALKSIVANSADSAFCAVFAIRTRPAMYVLRMYQDCLRMEQLAWPEELNMTPSVPDAVSDPATLTLAQTIVDGLRTDFDPSSYQNRQATAVAEAVAGGTVVLSGPDSNSALDALRAAVEALSNQTAAEKVG